MKLIDIKEPDICKPKVFANDMKPGEIAIVLAPFICGLQPENKPLQGDLIIRLNNVKCEATAVQSYNGVIASNWFYLIGKVSSFPFWINSEIALTTEVRILTKSTKVTFEV